MAQYLATAYVGLCHVFHLAFRETSEQNSVEVIREELRNHGHDPDDFINWVDLDTEAPTSQVDHTANATTVSWDDAVELYSGKSEDLAFRHKKMIEDLLTTGGLDQDMVSGVHKSLERAFA